MAADRWNPAVLAVLHKKWGAILTAADHPGAIPKVSAIVPNYNHGKVLANAIRALQAQTVRLHEIIVVDDGSTDDSRALLERLAEADPNLRVIHHSENRGAIAALNTGLAAATGDFIYLGAADDEARADLVAILGAAACRNPGLGLVCGEIALLDLATGAREFRPATRPSAAERAFSPVETRDLFGRTDNFILTGAALLDRGRVLACGGLRPELESLADGFLVRQLAFRHGFAFVPVTVAEWRVDRTGLSRRTASDPKAAPALLEAARRAFAGDPAFPPGYPDLFERRWRFGVLRLALERPATAGPLFEAMGTGPLKWPLVPALARVPAVGTPLALAVLTLAYRPFSLRGLVATALSRARS